MMNNIHHHNHASWIHWNIPNIPPPLHSTISQLLLIEPSISFGCWLRVAKVRERKFDELDKISDYLFIILLIGLFIHLLSYWRPDSSGDTCRQLRGYLGVIRKLSWQLWNIFTVSGTIQLAPTNSLQNIWLQETVSGTSGSILPAAPVSLTNILHTTASASW